MAGIVRMTLYTIIAMMMVAPRAAVWMTAAISPRRSTRRARCRRMSRSSTSGLDRSIFYLDPALRVGGHAGPPRRASFSEAMTRIRTDPPDAVTAVRNSQLPRFNRLFPAPPAPDALAGTFSLFRAETLRTALRVP